jgi:TRAP-type C4-dicarboxylate transport system permease small subunit
LMFAKIKKVFDKFLEVLLTVVMAILVLDVVWQVFTRYILQDPSSWTEELATFLMIWVGMLGASVALYRGAHLGIDYFVDKFSIRKRLYTEIFVFVCIGLFSLFVMLIGGVGLVNRTFVLGQVSPAMKIKMGYVYLALPISGFFLVMYSIELLIERIVALIKHKDIQTAHDIDAAAAVD